MAGSALAISTYSELENSTLTSQISAVINEWQIRFGRFISYHHSSKFTRTHPSLTPRTGKRGFWMSTASASASVKLIYARSPTGLDDAVLVLSLQSEILEEHFISKMHLSWPQASCVSGYPARGSRAVFVSYKDGADHIQKFALQFLTHYEAENFMNIAKEILKNGSPQQLQSLEFNSGVSSQNEAICSHGPTYKHKGEGQHTASEDSSNQLMHPSSELAEYSVSLEGIGKHEAAEAMSAFPPSFTEMMKNCNPAVAEANLTESGDLSSQFVQYLEGTSFKELLDTVDNVISQLGDDMVL
ncbi:hypothetical protein ACS0TY_009057 [Phlomoides rotata]